MGALRGSILLGGEAGRRPGWLDKGCAASGRSLLGVLPSYETGQ